MEKLSQQARKARFRLESSFIWKVSEKQLVIINMCWAPNSMWSECLTERRVVTLSADVVSLPADHLLCEIYPVAHRKSIFTGPSGHSFGESDEAITWPVQRFKKK